MALPIVAAAGGMLLTFAGSMVGRVLLALGMSYVAYQGFDLAIDWLEDSIKTNMSGMPTEIVQFLAWLWVDRAISMIFSAYGVAMAFKLAGSTTIKKLVTK